MMTLRTWRACAMLWTLCLILLTGCATKSASVSSSSELAPGEGLVVLRLVDPSVPPMTQFNVVSEATRKTYALSALRFGQENSSKTFVGVMPAGRYQPDVLLGTHVVGVNAQGAIIQQNITAPLAAWTGSFEVAPNRVTQLGTMVYYNVPDSSAMADKRGSSSKFVVSLDPTPVPVDALLAARFPKLSKAVQGTSPLGWVSGTLPAPRIADLMTRIRQSVGATNQPKLLDTTSVAAGGPLGVLAKRRYGEPPQILAAPTVQALTAWLVLQDGRWLVGGEQGYLALSSNAGKTWQPVSGLTPEDLVLHLTQASDGRLLLVTDRDREVMVFESAPGSLAWRELKRLPSDVAWFNKGIGTPSRRDYAVSSKDRLVIFTHPSTLNSLDMRTGQWESHETPRSFQAGIKVSPDGYVVGMLNPQWIWGSADYGKTWKRLESWIRTTEPHFLDRRRGMVLSAESGMMAQQKESFRFRTTEDGGATWKAGGEVPGSWFNELRPFGSDATGSLLFMAEPGRWVHLSKDQGRTWN